MISIDRNYRQSRCAYSMTRNVSNKSLVIETLVCIDFSFLDKAVSLGRVWLGQIRPVSGPSADWNRYNCLLSMGRYLVLRDPIPAQLLSNTTLIRRGIAFPARRRRLLPRTPPLRSSRWRRSAARFLETQRRRRGGDRCLSSRACNRHPRNDTVIDWSRLRKCGPAQHRSTTATNSRITAGYVPVRKILRRSFFRCTVPCFSRTRKRIARQYSRWYRVGRVILIRFMFNLLLIYVPVALPISCFLFFFFCLMQSCFGLSN